MRKHTFFLGLMAIVMLRCGGGGGGGSSASAPAPAPAPAITGFAPAAAAPGARITLTGSGFAGATGVSFNGTTASFTVDSDTQITATAPRGAAGSIRITAPGGTATSASAFTFYADTLAYTDPASGAYRLVRNAGLSTQDHLVLDLLGPSGAQGLGVSFFLQADASRAAWAKVSATDAEYVQNGTVFNLGSAPQLFRGRASAGALQAALYQKGAAATFPANAVLARVRLDLAAQIIPGTVSLSAPSGRAILQPPAGPAQSISLAVGTLAAQ